jgi:hypothetical protein
MQKEKSKIRVIESQTGQLLFECAVEESDKAYEFAAEMEEMGLEIKVEAPTMSEMLTESLGYSKQQLHSFQESIEEEIEGHEGSCCFEDLPDKNKLN